MKRAVTHAELQKDRRHKGQHAAADAAGKTAEQADRVDAIIKQLQAEQRIIIAARMHQVEQQREHTYEDHGTQQQRRAATAALTIQRQCQGCHSGGQQDKTAEIKAPRLHAVVGHQHQGGDSACDADRDIDQKDPVPAGVLHQHTAQRRTQQRANLAGQSDKRHGGHILLARHDFQHRQTTHRHHHGPANPLNHPRQHQLIEGAGEGAQQ